ncbi:hypothetical protein EG68_01250 [Paragonimus skrjabini miyazakii]|uniref:Uncharacterized protein n=1 Tax=Paragonimus skrjabini miyazakii TaxID=59628 RepID=A0A8S9Z8B2_9TREM|nr:hypothetical protein EG68_01250 [Paragonimus skrjabini miyazakii]
MCPIAKFQLSASRNRTWSVIALVEGLDFVHGELDLKAEEINITNHSGSGKSNYSGLEVCNLPSRRVTANSRHVPNATARKLLLESPTSEKRCPPVSTLPLTLVRRCNGQPER